MTAQPEAGTESARLRVGLWFDAQRAVPLRVVPDEHATSATRPEAKTKPNATAVIQRRNPTLSPEGPMREQYTVSERRDVLATRRDRGPNPWRLDDAIGSAERSSHRARTLRARASDRPARERTVLLRYDLSVIQARADRSSASSSIRSSRRGTCADASRTQEADRQGIPFFYPPSLSAHRRRSAPHRTRSSASSGTSSRCSPCSRSWRCRPAPRTSKYLVPERQRDE